MEPIKVTGMVLSAMAIGDYDKRLVILTKEKGKLVAFAKGARRQNSSFMAGSRPFSFGEFTLYEGRNSYHVMNMQISNYFSEISEDFYTTYYGFYFLELAEYYGRENVEAAEMLLLLYQSMRALLKPSLPNALIRCVFELKVLRINGEYPQVFQCVHCGKEEVVGFSTKGNGMFCEQCQTLFEDGILVDASVVYAMQYIISTQVEKLYTFTVTEPVLNTLRKVMDSYRKKMIEKEFKSLEILDQDMPNGR